MAAKNQNPEWSEAGITVSEVAAPTPGASSPFGDDVEFPLPVDQLTYSHPTAAERPNLAEGR